MTESWTPPDFEVVRRGYAPRQVDETFALLVQDFLALRAERDRLREATTDLQARLEQMPVAAPDAPTYRGIGDRVERILVLAEEEAAELRRSTAAQVDADSGAAREEAEALRADAEAYAEDQRAQADKDAEQSREEIARETESARATTAQELADCRRAGEAQLLDLEQRAAALRADCDAMLADAQRQAEEIIQRAEAHGRQIVHDAAVEADRSRVATERELTELTLRRDDIHRQLTNVRHALASLTGSADVAQAQAKLDDAMTSVTPSADDDATPAEQDTAPVAQRTTKSARSSDATQVLPARSVGPARR